MRTGIALVLATAILTAGPAHATPKRVPHYVFPTIDACMDALNNLWRGNHAFYCDFGPSGWYVAYDQGYEAAKKGPKPR